MDLSTNFAAAQRAVTEELVAVTRTSARIAAQDIAFSRSTDPAVATSIDQKSARLLELTQKLLNRANSSKSSKSSKTVRLPELDAIDTQWRRIVDAADSLYERADICLDEFSGLIKRNAAPASSARDTGDGHTQARSINKHRDAPMSKPQLQFQVKPPNHARPPFRPLLSSKPHAITPLKKTVSQEPVEGQATTQFQHPYEDEIHRYLWPPQVLHRQEPRLYRPFDSTTPIMVESVEGVHEMLTHLKSAEVIAVDLEHHDMHSYLGIVSLMQISTHEQDWIVDTLKPWRAELGILNEVFADPSILKVFHGAHMDVVWLQRDFGLYLVGLFDTHHACRILHYPGASLAYLLKRFVNFDAQKQHQLADWRIRPLPQELVDYARSDTHFLIYIYECLRIELLDANPAVAESTGATATDDLLARSKDTALQRYEYPTHTDDITSAKNQWAALLVRYPSEMSSEQVAVFASIHRWRDAVARIEDEGVHQVLPNHAIFTLAKAKGIDSKAAIFSNVYSVSGVLRQHADGLLSAMQTAKESSAGGPNSTTVFEKFPSRQRRHLPPETKGPLTVNGKQTLLAVGSSNEGSLRSDQSTFWGATLAHHTSSSTKRPPLFDLVHDFPVRPASDPVLGKEADAENLEPPRTVEGSNGTGSDNLVQLSKKRKLGENSQDDAPEPTVDSEEALQAVEKRAKRKQKKARKKAKADLNGGGEGASDTANTGEAFNYETASSVLHAPPPAPDSQTSASPRKPLNPYAKAENAASGLKKTSEYHGGRSHTYR